MFLINYIGHHLDIAQEGLTAPSHFKWHIDTRVAFEREAWHDTKDSSVHVRIVCIGFGRCPRSNVH